MNSLVRRAAILACLVLFQGCGISNERTPVEASSVALDGMIIRNELVYPVKNVMITVPVTGNFAGCGNIMPRSDCRTRFEAVDYAGNAMLVNWTEYGQQHSTKEFTVEPGSEISRSGTAWLEVTIFAPGQAGAKLVQAQD